MIIDAHSHYMPPTVARETSFFKVNWSDVPRQLKVMDTHSIDKALLLYPTSDAHLNMGGWQAVCQAYNQGIADVVREHPDRFIGAGILPIDAPEAFEAQLHRIQDLGLNVISMASSYEGCYLDDEKFFPIYAFAQQHGLPIHVHAQILNPIGEERVQDPLLSPVLEYVFDISMCIGKLMMSGTLTQFPDVTFIFAHYGGVLPLVKERFDNTYQMLRQRHFVKDLGKRPGDYFKNLYFDTSGSRSAAALQGALEVTDAAHILYGSDFPANQTMADTLSVIRTQGLSTQEETQIMGSNLVSLIR